jgi:heme/copper-type cytochrome/quinol oxidase subunit 3
MTMTDTVSWTPEDRDAEEAEYHHQAALYAAWTGSRLLIGALSFLFGAFAFAYFYLRSLNSHGMWRPKGLHHPALWLGTLIMALVVASAAVQALSVLRLKRGGSNGTWRRGALAALAFGLVAVGLQIYQLLHLKFFPGSSGFSSLFAGFFPVYVLVIFLALCRLEILIAESGRMARGDTMDLQRFQASLSAFTSIWNFLAAVAVVAWVLFYLAP